MIEAVVFDLYGTLIRLARDTKPYLGLARRLRRDDSRAVVLQSLLIDSRGVGDFAARLGLPWSPETEALDADLRRDLSSAHAFEDAVETLAALRGRGLKLGLISNLAAPYKEPFDRLGLAAYFDLALFSCDVGLRKPDPRIYLRMVEGLGVKPAHAVMVGDGLRPDYDGARAAGMQAVLLRKGAEGPSGRWIGALADLPSELRISSDRGR